MPGGRRRRRVPWFFIPPRQQRFQPQQQLKGKTINTINTMASAHDFDDNLNNFFPTTDLSEFSGHPRTTDS